MIWNSINVNVDVDFDIDEIINGMSNSDKVQLICGMKSTEIQSILVNKGLMSRPVNYRDLTDYEGRKLKELLCDISGDSYHVDVDNLLINIKSKL
jgi:hypothetical protein